RLLGSSGKIESVHGPFSPQAIHTSWSLSRGVFGSSKRESQSVGHGFGNPQDIHSIESLARCRLFCPCGRGVLSSESSDSDGLDDSYSVTLEMSSELSEMVTGQSSLSPGAQAY